MGRQRFTPKQIISKLREADVLVGRGSTAVEACRQIGLSTTSTRNDQNASLAARLRCAPHPAKAGIGGDLQLTMQPDQSSRAVHRHDCRLSRASSTCASVHLPCLTFFPAPVWVILLASTVMYFGKDAFEYRLGQSWLNQV